MMLSRFADQIFERSPFPLAVLNLDYTLRYINRAMAEYIGFPRDKLIGRQCFEAIHNRSSPCPTCLIDEVLAKKEPRHVVKHVTTAAGKENFFEQSWYPILDSRGKPEVVLEVIKDVSDQMKAERALKESEARYRDLVEKSLDGIYIIQDGRFVFTNPAFCRIHGFEPGNMTGRPITDTIHPGDLDKVVKGVARREKGKELTVRYRFRIVRPDGETKHVEVVSTHITFNGRGAVQGILRDVTDEIKAREAIETSRAYLDSILNNMWSGLVVLDRDLRIVDINRKFAKTFAKRFEEIMGRHCYQIIHHLDRPCYELGRPCPTKEVFDTEKPVSREMKHLDSTGREVFSEVSATPLFDADGKIYRVIEMMQDITDRRQAQKDLKQSEGQYRSLIDDVLDTSSVGIFILDCDFKVIWVNRALERYFGLKRNEIIGKDKRQLIRERIKDIFEDPDGFEEKVLSTYHNNTYTENFECHVLADGERKERWLEHWSQPIRSGIYAGGRIEHYTDITQIKLSEVAVKQSEERFRTIFERSPDPIHALDAQGRIIDCNQAEADLLGYEKSELIGKHISELITPESLDKFKVNYPLFKKQGFIEDEFDFIRKDGQILTLWFNASSTYDDQGNFLSSITVLRDVTEKKRLEEQVRQSRKMAAIGLLSGGIAHDFNNLLTPIIGHCDLLLSTLSKDDPIAKDVKAIHESAQRAADLIRQLLIFSRRQVVEPKVLNLNDIIRGLEKMLRRIIGEDIELSTILDEDLGNVEADPGNMEQVIVNIVVNARDAMPTGGKLIIEAANVELDEAYAKRHFMVKSGRYVMMSITDTGCGMSPETIVQVFDPFFTTKEKGKGTGLGLSTVYGIVKKSGGYIWVYSEPNQGTTVKVYLPRVDKVRDKIEKKEMSDALPRGTETILVVEDDDQVREITARILKRQGYEVLTARHGGEALLICERRVGPIHLLLTDVVMPQMSGKEFAERLRQIRQDFKVLYMSGYTDNAIELHGILEPGIHFLQKPFTPSAIARKVREVLDRDPGD